MSREQRPRGRVPVRPVVKRAAGAEQALRRQHRKTRQEIRQSPEVHLAVVPQQPGAGARRAGRIDDEEGVPRAEGHDVPLGDDHGDCAKAERVRPALHKSGIQAL